MRGRDNASLCHGSAEWAQPRRSGPVGFLRVIIGHRRFALMALVGLMLATDRCDIVAAYSGPRKLDSSLSYALRRKGNDEREDAAEGIRSGIQGKGWA